MKTLAYNADQTKAQNKFHQIWLIQLTGILAFIKQVPWFTLLLILLLGYGSYQIAMRPQSPAHVWVKQSAQKVKHSISKTLSASRKKTLEPEVALVSPRRNQVDQTPPQVVPKQTNLDYEAKLITLEKHCKALQSTIDHFDQERKEVRKEMNAFKLSLESVWNVDLEKDYKALKARVDTFTQEKKDLLKEMEALKLTLENSQKKDINPQPLAEVATGSKEVAPNVNAVLETDYSVRAVIQGRVWLNTKEGKIITVSVGSQLPILGIVQAIDAENRLVYFDGGEVIGPPPMDC